jgi:hypothetical protein
MPLTKGWTQVCVDLIKRVIRDCWRGFLRWRPRLTMVWPMSASLTQLKRSFSLMMLIKNLRRHSLPLKKNLVPRFDNKIRAIPSIMTRVTKEKDISVYTSRYLEFRWNKRYKVHSSLPQRRSWESGRWMSTWTANNRQILLAMQRYIPTSIQRSDSNTSKNWVMGGSVAQVLLPTYFGASSRHRQRRRRNNLLGEERNRRERWLVAGGPKTS